MLEITKEQLAELPIAQFPGRSIVINSPRDSRAAIAYLRRQQRLGFDTETRPSFRKGVNRTVALLQLSTADECFLFRLHHTGFTDEMVALFADRAVQKIGLSIKDDIHSLSKLREFSPESMVELQTFVKDYDISDNSLQKVYAIIFNERISKGQRLSNWEAETLSEAQQTYASLDAYACLKIYERLIGGGFDPAVSPYAVMADDRQDVGDSVAVGEIY